MLVKIGRPKPATQAGRADEPSAVEETNRLNHPVRRCRWVVLRNDSLPVVSYGVLRSKVPHPSCFSGHNRYGYVTNVYTEPDLRGHGIGSQLPKRAMEWAREQELEFQVRSSPLQPSGRKSG